MSVATALKLCTQHARGWRTLSILPWILGLFVIALFTVRVALPAAEQLSGGYLSYYIGAQVIRSGAPATKLYDDAWFSAQVRQASAGRVTDVFLANPPTLAVAWLPLAYLSVDSARRVWIAASVLCMLLALWLIALELGWRRQPWLLVGISAVLLLSAPTREQFHLGQMYALLLLLQVLGWRGYVRRNEALAGAALGSALALKIAAWPIGLLLLARGRWQAALWALATVAAAALLSLPRIGSDAWEQLLLTRIPQTLRWGALSLTTYQDSAGFWQHLLRYDADFNRSPLLDAPALAAVLTVATIIVASYALVTSRRPDRIAFPAAVVLTELLSPMAEQYHFVVLWLPLAVLWNEVWQRRSPLLLAAALVATVLMAAPIDYKAAHAAWNLILDYPRLIGGWILFAALLCSPQSGRTLEQQHTLGPVNALPRTSR